MSSYVLLDLSTRELVAGAATFLAVLLYFSRSTSDRSKNLPPGPRGLPILGNWLSLPSSAGNPWEVYKQWSRQYGSDILHLNAFGTDLIIVNSHKAASTLLERKSALYSERPRMTMINELINLNWHFGFMNHGDTWRTHRKIFAQHFNPTATIGLRSQTTKWNNLFLNNILNSPKDFFTHIQHMASGHSLEATFGLQVQPSGKADPFIGAATEAIQALRSAGLFGSYLVDYLPFLKYIPFGSFQKDAAQWKVSTDIAVTVPFNLVKDAMSKGGVEMTSMASRLLENGTFNENDIRKTTSAAFANGSAATVSAIQTFFLAMLLYPDVPKRAQTELDKVVQGRLPDFSDEASLPYISALVKEVLRWNPAVPLAFPHQLTRDDTYESYHLPAGSVVIPNAWAMLQDTSIYGPNTTVFNPSRFLKPDGSLDRSVKDPDFTWGFGRRVCPGKHFAESVLYLVVATTLAAFDISSEERPSGEYTSGLIRYPKPFECTIKPRTEAYREMIISLSEQ
ncbi:cytochrome P450 [Dendrothele bispora CBS 962.96]|uniref:Cytochrome P450 n=1 Tax=Dendrothele bispora (strain CBS 962.96) TaxID=1314807 RepID=A0A4S8KMT8_DENBC|nr:cytochrome P450 [Dendrothele bispora CBS 962.96]